MEAFLQERAVEGKEAADAREKWQADMAKIGKDLQALENGTFDEDRAPHLFGR